LIKLKFEKMVSCTSNNNEVDGASVEKIGEELQFLGGLLKDIACKMKSAEKRKETWLSGFVEMWTHV